MSGLKITKEDIPIENIYNDDDITKFIKYCNEDLKLPFHPDIDFADYKDQQTRKPLLPPDVAGRLNWLLNQCFLRGKNRIYELTLAVQIDYLAAFQPFVSHGFNIFPSKDAAEIILQNPLQPSFVRVPVRVLKEVVQKLQPANFFVLHYSNGCIEQSGPFANTDTARQQASKLYQSQDYDPECDSLHLLSFTNGAIDVTDYSESELLEGAGDDDEQ